MAHVDNLDTLTNAQLRQEMIAQGLPNIPVTDTSRKVLVKRLRASLGGNATLPVSAVSATPKKTSGNRRETLQAPTATVAPAQLDKPDGAKSRRTVAAPPSETKETERRRKPEAVVPLPRVAEAPTTTAAVAPIQALKKPAATAGPIQTRRTSTTDRREPTNERVVVKPPERIPEEPPKTKQNTLLVNSLIVLESDEEEDEQLAEAAQHAEKQYSDARNVHKQQPTKLTTSKTNTQEFKSLYPRLEPLVPRPNINYEPPSLPSSSSRLRTIPVSSTDNLAGRYSSYVSPSVTQGYRPTAAVSSTSYAAASGAATSSYLRTPPRTFTNEFSDDAEEDPSDQRFESEFARKLANLRSERIGDRSSPFNRRTIASPGYATSVGYEPTVRRSLRPDNEGVAVALERWCQSLERKYHVKTLIFVAIVLMLIYVVYRIFY